MTGSITHWLSALKTGDDRAAQELWNRYYTDVVRIARRRRPMRLSGMSDEEDVVLQAFASFFRGINDGRFPDIADRHGLWRLLICIAGRKLQAIVRHEGRKKRSRPGAYSGAEFQDLDGVASDELLPELAVEIADTLRDLLECLNDGPLQQVVISKLEGYSHDEIAAQLGCSTSTIERKLRRIRHEWSHRTGMFEIRLGSERI